MSNFISHLFSRVQFVEEEDEEEQEGGLLVELEGKDEKKERETSLWFSKVCLLHYLVFLWWLVSCLFIHVISELPRGLQMCFSVRPLTRHSFALKGIFSEIDIEGDAESELRQTEWLQVKQTGNGQSSIFILMFSKSLQKKKNSHMKVYV